MVRSDERSSRFAFNLVSFVALLIAGIILLVFASTTIWAEGETIFYLPLGIPGIVAVLAGAIGISLVALAG